MAHCPTCGRQFDPQQSAAMPFCSQRCRTIDLGRWLDETIRLPVLPDPDEDVETPKQNGRRPETSDDN